MKSIFLDLDNTLWMIHDILYASIRKVFLTSDSNEIKIITDRMKEFSKPYNPKNLNDDRLVYIKFLEQYGWQHIRIDDKFEYNFIIKPRPFMVEFVRRMKAKCDLLGACTTASEDLAIKALEQCGIRDLFDEVYAREAVYGNSRKGIPDGEIILIDDGSAGSDAIYLKERFLTGNFMNPKVNFQWHRIHPFEGEDDDIVLKDFDIG
jgi:phosphoglycolate phosphatase-like HAD superfamily hydrolase